MSDTTRKMQSEIKTIVDQYGTDLYCQPNRFYAMLLDSISGQKKFLNLLRILSGENIFEKIYCVTQVEKEDFPVEKNKLINHYTSTFGISREAIETVFDVLAFPLIGEDQCSAFPDSCEPIQSMPQSSIFEGSPEKADFYKEIEALTKNDDFSQEDELPEGPESDKAPEEMDYFDQIMQILERRKASSP